MEDWTGRTGLSAPQLSSAHLTSVTGVSRAAVTESGSTTQETSFMRKIAGIAFLSLIVGGLSVTGPAQRVPQTARQALLEMFFGKESGTFVKHLPGATRATLEKSGALANLQQYSLMATSLQTQGKNLQTFETGPVMFATVDPKTGQKLEVRIDRESPRGDQDDIELSFRTYKDNQPQKTPFMPKILCSMKKESDLWTLNTISVTISLPLADPDLLKGFSDQMKLRAASGNPQIQIQPQPQISHTSFGNDPSTLADVRKILAAETTYRDTYSSVGYTCALSDLDGFGGAEPGPHQAMLISSSLASGKHLGYLFSLSRCAGAPAASFQLTATPIGESYGRRAFCADQSGTIRSSADGNGPTCLSSGTPLP